MRGRRFAVGFLLLTSVVVLPRLVRAETAPAAAGPAQVVADPEPVRTPTTPVLTAPRRVSPTAAVFASAVFPGWGQLAADNAWRAALAFGFEGWFLARLAMYDRKALRARDRGISRTVEVEYWELKRDNAWWAGGALFIIALDAYVGAHLDGFDHDHVPVPDAWDPGEIPQPIELPPPPPGGAPILRLSAGF